MCKVPAATEMEKAGLALDPDAPVFDERRRELRRQLAAEYRKSGQLDAALRHLRRLVADRRGARQAAYRILVRSKLKTADALARLPGFGPGAQVFAGIVLLIWPGLALWLVALVLGGGLILSGISGLSALRDSQVVNPSIVKKVEYWLIIGLGVLLIVMGAAGSALLLGTVLGVALISIGLQQWRLAGISA
mgnify:CR=1 FL=1